MAFEMTIANSVLTFVFFFTFVLPTSSQSCNICQSSFFDELKIKSDAATLLCSPNKAAYINLPLGKSCCESLSKELEKSWYSYNKLCPSAKRNKQCPSAMSTIITRQSTVDYAISQGAPQMNEVTMCFWVKTKQLKQVTGNAHYISYAVPLATNQIYVMSQTNLRLGICHHNSNLGNSHSLSSHNITINDGLWHHICVTWQANGGRYSFFKDGNKVGNGAIPDSVGKPIPGQGTWVLGQDQDSVGGGFERFQSAIGEFTGVNVWDKVLSSFEILKMSTNCKAGGPAGNVKTWADFLSGIKGNAKIGKATCC
ncbi:C-reactive protein 1.1-like [Dendronephthya gigantea]|uniref:C-reactive protein 1.1-like n=1 Tax=Dendronephthya gigantea TaxID=151771 RepID=UPI001068F63F|nr:C-reactive protein 1.1-like [Dendronephthya gigantea]XP_028399930.1 C-reactive protein 1.1-like [Dendronephthya gigantea]